MLKKSQFYSPYFHSIFFQFILPVSQYKLHRPSYGTIHLIWWVTFKKVKPEMPVRKSISEVFTHACMIKKCVFAQNWFSGLNKHQPCLSNYCKQQTVIQSYLIFLIFESIITSYWPHWRWLVLILVSKRRPIYSYTYIDSLPALIGLPPVPSLASALDSLYGAARYLEHFNTYSRAFQPAAKGLHVACEAILCGPQSQMLPYIC